MFAPAIPRPRAQKPDVSKFEVDLRLAAGNLTPKHCRPSYAEWLLFFRNPEQQQTGHASGTFHVMPLHFAERLCVTDVGDVEPF